MTRLRDIVIAAILIILSLPLWILAIAAIVVEKGGNPFYRSSRIGMLGRTFGMLKFRTMVNDGGFVLNKEQRAEFEKQFKVSNDPRVTKVGRWLRRFSIDELPQLINVARGDMALVGPRPKLPEEIHLYGSSRDELLSVRPGLTGYWQVYRKSANSDSEMREMDLYYVRHKSVGLDTSLLFRTIAVVFSRENY